MHEASLAYWCNRRIVSRLAWTRLENMRQRCESGMRRDSQTGSEFWEFT